MRLEDLDPQRSKPEFEETQLADLEAIGIDWDGPPVRQSERGPRHDDSIAALVAQGRTYECWCSRAEIRDAASAAHGEVPEGAYQGTCRRLTAAQRADRRASGRPSALRLDAHGEEVSFEDRVQGRVAGAVDDFVLRRGDGTPAYNLAVVVDDADAGIGEVVRGEDLLDSTPRQLLLARLLGLEAPSYAHLPLVLGEDGARLAKRHGAVTVADIGAEAARAWILDSLGEVSGRPEEFHPGQIPRAPVSFRGSGPPCDGPAT